MRLLLTRRVTVRVHPGHPVEQGTERGMQRGLAAERELPRRQVERKFDTATAEELARRQALSGDKVTALPALYVSKSRCRAAGSLGKADGAADHGAESRKFRRLSRRRATAATENSR